MKIKTTAALFAAALMFVTPFSAYAADELVYDDFNQNDVNGEVGFVLPKDATGTFTITFESPEGKEISYYKGSIESGKDYAFLLEGRDNTDDDYRYYTLSVQITGGNYGRTSETFTDIINGKDKGSFIIHDPHDNPDTYQKCVYKFAIDDKDTGKPWDITASDKTSKTVTFHLNASVPGDVTGDGIVDAIDASTVLTAYAKASTGKEMGLTDSQQAIADVDSNKKIDANDATLILSYYAYTSVGKDISLADFVKMRSKA